MEIRPFTPNETQAYAELLALAFDRKVTEMCQLLTFLQMAAPLLSYGAWEGEQLAAQYSCLLRSVHIPGRSEPIKVGVSLNMAVHPHYRGRGLVKQVAAPVYEAVRAAGGVAGAGFSNAAGVKVDRRSKGYGYRVVGRLRPTLAVLMRRPRFMPLRLTDEFPTLTLPANWASSAIRFESSPAWLRHRFAQHPFRHYRYGVGAQGVVVYRPWRWGGLRGAALLAAHGEDLAQLLGCWLSALWQSNMRGVHVLTSPQSAVCAALRPTAMTFSLPYSRTPYYLTVKSLGDETPACLFDFSQWECVGGDIL